MISELERHAEDMFRERFETPPHVPAFAPRRLAVLGNHTDHNEGYVVSAATHVGTLFGAAPAPDASNQCVVVAADLSRTARFPLDDLSPRTEEPWANYVIGVTAGLAELKPFDRGYRALVTSNLPMGAGLSSSAAIELSSALALARLNGLNPQPRALAMIAQRAEHDFVGVRCGLLDQFTSLFGTENSLVLTDFRSLEVEQVPLSEDARFLMCDTAVTHSLVDGQYNERRKHCEEARDALAALLGRPVAALRDVSEAELRQHASSLDPVAARRAAHVVGENARVLKGRDCLASGDLEGFGRLMFESHESSIRNFENSCPELDFVVATARKLPGVLGARLSGGGFGGSAAILIHARDAETGAQALSSAYLKQFNRPCTCRTLVPSAGAALLSP